MRVADFPELALFKGHTLIHTDGTTLLGADDKAGVAEIMTAAEYLLAHPEIAHGKIRIGFTPDEEVGRGVDYFDVAAFGADFAYTVDGGMEGELEYENFNAASAKIAVQGRNVHPGLCQGQDDQRHRGGLRAERHAARRRASRTYRRVRGVLSLRGHPTGRSSAPRSVTSSATTTPRSSNRRRVICGARSTC